MSEGSVEKEGAGEMGKALVPDGAGFEGERL